MGAEYNEVQWMQLLAEAKEEIGKLQRGFTLWQFEDSIGASKLLPQWIEAQHKHKPLQEVYDIGCGLGLLSVFMRLLSPTAEIRQIDRDPLETSYPVRQKFRLTYFVADVCESAMHVRDSIPDTLDTIVMADMIQFLDYSPVQVFELCRHALMPGGMLYVSCPDSASTHGKIYKYVTGWSELKLATSETYRSHAAPSKAEAIWNYNKTEVLEIAAAAGLRLVRMGYSASNKGLHLNFAFTK